MQRESSTSDPAGTCVSVIGGLGCALFGFIAFGPLGAIIMGGIAAAGTKHDTKKAAEQELDDIALENCDQIAGEWLSDSDHSSAEVSVSIPTNGLIPLMQTRNHFYTHKPADLANLYPLHNDDTDSDNS